MVLTQQTETVNIPVEINTTDLNETIDLSSNITEKTTELIEAEARALEWKRKFEEERDRSKKRNSKRQKRIEKKTAQVRVTDIPTCDHLTEPQQYQARNYVRRILWRNVKYWHNSFEQKVVKKTLKLLDIRNKAEKEKYKDFTCAYVRQLLTTKRNNSIAALKRKVTRNIESKYIAAWSVQCIFL